MNYSFVLTNLYRVHVCAVRRVRREPSGVLNYLRQTIGVCNRVVAVSCPEQLLARPRLNHDIRSTHFTCSLFNAHKHRLDHDNRN